MESGTVWTNLDLCLRKHEANVKAVLTQVVDPREKQEQMADSASSRDIHTALFLVRHLGSGNRSDGVVHECWSH